MGYPQMAQMREAVRTSHAEGRGMEAWLLRNHQHVWNGQPLQPATTSPLHPDHRGLLVILTAATGHGCHRGKHHGGLLQGIWNSGPGPGPWAVHMPQRPSGCKACVGCLHLQQFQWEPSRVEGGRMTPAVTKRHTMTLKPAQTRKLFLRRISPDARVSFPDGCRVFAFLPVNVIHFPLVLRITTCFCQRRNDITVNPPV